LLVAVVSSPMLPVGLPILLAGGVAFAVWLIPVRVQK